MSSYEGTSSGPEGGKGACVVKDVHIEAVFQIVVSHEAEDIVVDVAEVVDLNGASVENRSTLGRLTSGSTLQYQS